MAIKDALKISRKTYFDPAAWIGYSQIKANTVILWSTIRALLRMPAKPRRTETFKQAMTRLKLTEEDIQKTGNQYLFYSIFFVILGGLTFSSSLYLFFESGFLAGLFTLLMTLLFLSQAFRFHFLHFQIKHHKLGCTFKEWWQGKPFHEGRKS